MDYEDAYREHIAAKNYLYDLHGIRTCRAKAAGKYQLTLFEEENKESGV